MCFIFLNSFTELLEIIKVANHDNDQLLVKQTNEKNIYDCDLSGEVPFNKLHMALSKFI